jgi:hypothetical protein
MSFIKSLFSIILSAIFYVVAAKDPSFGIFDQSTDIGALYIAGSSSYDSVTQSYTMTASGAAIGTNNDQFRFVWKRVNGNFILRCRTAFNGAAASGGLAGIMVRNSLDRASAHVAATISGAGANSLLFRTAAGGQSQERTSSLSSPDVLQLDRRGTTVVMSSAVFGGTFTKDSIVNASLSDTLYVGLFACSHDSIALAAVRFANVQIVKATGTIGTNVELLDVDSGYTKVLFTTQEHWQSPNLKKDNVTVYFNKDDGGLYTFNLTTKAQNQVNTGQVNSNNNDHVLSWSETMTGISAGSANAASAVYTVAAAGGIPVQITTQGVSYLHGWSPDDKYLVFTGMRNNDFDVYRIPAAGGQEVRLTTAAGLDDGPEYTPDGAYIYFHSVRSGFAKIWRMAPDGSNQTQLTFDSFNDWFPHPSRDGNRMVFLTFGLEVSPSDHPANKQVYIRTTPIGGGTPKTVGYVFGGQGTLNVPCWTSDSKKIVFFSYSQPLPAIANVMSVAPTGSLKPQAILSSGTGGNASVMFDDNLATTWHGQGFPQSFEIDLGAVYSLVYANMLPAAQRPYQFTVEAKSASSDPYILVLDASANTVGDGLIQKPFLPNASGRFVKVTVTGVSGLTSSVDVNEFEIFGGLNIPLASMMQNAFSVPSAKDISVVTLLAHPELFRTVCIYDGTGRCLAKSTAKAFAGELRTLARGVYVVKVLTKSNAQVRLRLDIPSLTDLPSR